MTEPVNRTQRRELRKHGKRKRREWTRERDAICKKYNSPTPKEEIAQSVQRAINS